MVDLVPEFLLSSSDSQGQADHSLCLYTSIVWPTRKVVWSFLHDIALIHPSPPGNAWPHIQLRRYKGIVDNTFALPRTRTQSSEESKLSAWMERRQGPVLVGWVLPIHWLSQHVQISRDALGWGWRLRLTLVGCSFHSTAAEQCAERFCPNLHEVSGNIYLDIQTFYNRDLVPTLASSTLACFKGCFSQLGFNAAVSSAWKAPSKCLFLENSTHTLRPMLKSCLLLAVFPDYPVEKVCTLLRACIMSGSAIIIYLFKIL